MAKRSPRLIFTEEERALPELERAVRKADRAADKLEKAEAKIPKENRKGQGARCGRREWQGHNAPFL